MSKKTCFVVMGYGEKTDFATGRVLDLDKTYHNIIKPVVEEEMGMICKRADEIRHSGSIDQTMYEELITADLVIADLSTANMNAVYELGVRHALRPFTTLVIAEKQFQKPFDVNHTVILPYEHLGTDIGFSETMRFRKELKETITEIIDKTKKDSPVYINLEGLEQPVWNRGGASVAQPDSDNSETLGHFLQAAKEALDKDNFIEAKSLYNYAHKIDPTNSYIVQKLVLATYKSKHPDHVSALHEALKTLESLTPETSTDPETLGLAGAIYKRLWEEQPKPDYLDKAIQFYEKGFYVKNDYYNGINLAYLLNLRGSQSQGNDAIADYVVAERVRKHVVQICEQLMESELESRSDRYWIAATLEEAFFGLGIEAGYIKAKRDAERLAKENWERDTTVEQLEKLKRLLEASPLK